ncbi:hypothetical protein F4677DRAFT_440297 [Hypoxylon crocopeplum]|nr:hypothetical protein F4677DRAFT_440297 [Hypoxylon crocopeplum]
MKPVFLLTLIAGLASSVVEGSERIPKEARRPQPAYEADIVHPSLKLDKVNLKQVPQSLLHAESKEAAVSSRQFEANDFYECRQTTLIPTQPQPKVRDSKLRSLVFVSFPITHPLTLPLFHFLQSPLPADSDCNKIIDEVLALDTPLIIAPNACLLFQYSTCWGFFCALCSQLSTDTGFVGNQLISAEALCVANGQIGTVISIDSPQWEAGFIYQGSSLPQYEVC